jgi:hypothetical protein
MSSLDRVRELRVARSALFESRSTTGAHGVKMSENFVETTQNCIRIAATASASCTFCTAETPVYVDFGSRFVDGSKLVKALGTQIEHIVRSLYESTFPKGALSIRLEAHGTWTCHVKVPSAIGDRETDCAMRSFLSQVIADGYAPAISGDELALLPQRTSDQIRTSALHILRKPPVAKGRHGAPGIVDCSLKYPGRDLLLVRGPIRPAPAADDLSDRTGFVTGEIDGARLSQRALWVWDPVAKNHTKLNFERDEQLEEAQALAALGLVRFEYSHKRPNGREQRSLIRAERV